MRADESPLDGYRVTCLLEQLDERRWEVTAQLHLNGSPRAEVKFPTKILSARSRTGRLDVAPAKKGALEYVIDSVSAKLSMFNMRGDRIAIFGPTMWEDGTKFHFR